MTDNPDGKRSVTWRSVIFFLLKILLAGSIVYVLVSRQREAVAECFRNFNYWYLVPALPLYFTHMIVCALRWRALAAALGVQLSRMEERINAPPGCCRIRRQKRRRRRSPAGKGLVNRPEAALKCCPCLG